MKKIVFNTYPRFGLDQGGLQVQIKRTADALLSMGYSVVYHDQWHDIDATADVLHCFSVDVSNLYLAKRAKKIGIPVVVSPVLNVFESPLWLTKLKVLAARIPGVYSDWRRAIDLLHMADKIIALNQDEKNVLERCCGVNADKIVIIPNGVDDKYYDASPELFQKEYPLMGKFILQVGSVDKRKNQIHVVKAMKYLEGRVDVNFRYVVVGPIRDESFDYKKSIDAVSSKKVEFLGAFDNNSKILPSVYAAAECFILPSYSEVMPLVIYEAAAAGCKILVSDNVPVDIRLEPYVFRFNPNNYKEIGDVIESSMFTDQPCRIPVSDLKKIIPSWSDVGVLIGDFYSGLKK